MASYVAVYSLNHSSLLLSTLSSKYCKILPEQVTGFLSICKSNNGYLFYATQAFTFSRAFLKNFSQSKFKYLSIKPNYQKKNYHDKIQHLISTQEYDTKFLPNEHHMINLHLNNMLQEFKHALNYFPSSHKRNFIAQRIDRGNMVVNFS